MGTKHSTREEPKTSTPAKQEPLKPQNQARIVPAKREPTEPQNQARNVPTKQEPTEPQHRVTIATVNKKLTRPGTERSKGARKKGGFETTVIKHRKNDALVCAAIDFGTTYSGYAYSFKSNEDEILTNIWSFSRTKTPTVVLMDPNKVFHAFGEEARTQYENLIKTGKHVEWYYFEKFKMKLFVKECPLHSNMDVEDILGRSMKAVEIFTAAIRYICQHMMKGLNDPTIKDAVYINKEDIHWVLTVPAIWNDLSKHFMREAAKNAGIPSEMLTLALEPEVASLFCRKELGLAMMSEGCRYMVVDLGGGTADITCHEVQDNDTLKEIHPPSGGDFGGTTVDYKFLSIITSIIGAKEMKYFKDNHIDKYWELINDFEVKKRTFTGTGEVRFQFPTRLTELFEENVEMNFNDTLKQWSYDKIKFKQGKIHIPEKQMREIFDVAVKQVIDMVRLLQNEVGRIEHIILVGGFSESPYLQRVMRENFYNLLVLPKEPSTAVLKGAVIYGNKTKAISSRTCRYTYGIARMIKFIPGVHPERKKITMGQFTYCDDAFNKHIEVGTVVTVDTAEDAEYHEYFPSTYNQNMAILEVYKSKRRDPKFVDEEGCESVGYIKVDDINPQNDKWCKLLVRLIFGGTELIVEIRDDKNSSLIRGTVDFLG